MLLKTTIILLLTTAGVAKKSKKPKNTAPPASPHRSSSAAQTSRSATSTITNIPTSTPYSIPIAGPSVDKSILWGVNVTKSQDGMGPPMLYGVSIGDENPASVATPMDSFIAHAIESPIYLVATTDGKQELALGPSNNLTATAATAPNVTVPTIPFGLNVGFRGSWNGSITLNGHYDSNRIKSTAWTRIEPSSDRSNVSFFKDGILHFRGALRTKDHGNGETFDVVLALNETAISLPLGYICQEISIELLSTIRFSIPQYLLKDKSRCEVRAVDVTGYGDKVVILGIPFWQAAYIYVESHGHETKVYAAQANDYDLPPKAEKFDATQRLTPPNQPDGYKSPTSAGVALQLSLYISLLAAILFL